MFIENRGKEENKRKGERAKEKKVVPLLEKELKRNYRK